MATSTPRRRPTPAPASPAARLVLLGQPALEAAHAVHALTRKDAALLAVLALGGPTAAARLATLLWPDAQARSAANSLRQRIHRLRRSTGHGLVDASATVTLLASVTTDLGAAIAALEQDPAAAADELLGALEFGDLPELDEWLQAARARWREQCVDALAAAAARAESNGALVQALAYAQRLVAEQPYGEHGHRRLMRLHYLRGDRAAALAAHARCCALLQRDLGTQPGRETLELAQLIERSGALQATAPAALAPAVAIRRPPQLIGREAEWAQLEAAWEAHRVVLVQGEPGIGKTRLLADFAAARPGSVVVGSRPGDAGLPYALLARLMRAAVQQARPTDGWVIDELARIAPELGAAVATKLEPLRLRQAVQAALATAAAAGWQAVWVDDLQFADEASRELLLAAAAETRASLRWGWALRRGDLPPAVAVWADACDADALLRLELGPFNLAATQALLQSLALPQLDAQVWAAPLFQHTGGNPMFMLETLRAIASGGAPPQARLPVPANVGALIDRRLAALSAPSLKLARVAALAGPDFSAELAAQVLGVHALDLAEPWRELESAQVIRGDAFAHDLIFEATLRSVPQQIARLMNQRIAAFLEAQGAAPARVAPHWLDAGQWGRAGHAFALAALDARRLSQRAREVELWQRAATCHDQAGEPDAAFDARRESIESLILVAGAEPATQVVDALQRQARTDAQRAAALTALANLRLMSADPVAGVAAAREAHDLARGFDSPWPRFEAARLLAIGLSQLDRADEALALIEPYRGIVEHEGSREQRGHFWADYAYALNSARRLRATADALEQGITHARALGDVGELATLTSNLALVSGNLGRTEAALEQALRARALRGQLGQTGGPPGAAIDMYVGLYSAMLGRYGEALASLDAALEVFAHDQQTQWVAVASNHKASVLLDLGQGARARSTLAYATPAMASLRARRAVVESRLERALGRSGDKQIEAALAELGERGDAYLLMLTEIDAALALPAALAAARCDGVRCSAEKLEYEGVAVKARLWGARHRLRAGDAARAAAELHELLPQLQAVRPADMYFPQAWWMAFEVFEAHGEREAATTALRRGLAWIHEVALPQVPDEFRAGFLQANAVNRALLTTATRRGGA